jgi:hypothetical protein
MSLQMKARCGTEIQKRREEKSVKFVDAKIEGKIFPSPERSKLYHE